MTPNTTAAPAAAPSLASDRAKQLASLASRISRPSAACRSVRRGRPISQVELAFLMTPAAVSLPGIAIPTLPFAPVASYAARTRSTKPRTGPS
jgi:hypothetical protein